MDKYIIVERKIFEKKSAFEKRINDTYGKGYKAINLTNGPEGSYSVLMEKVS